MTQYNEPRPRIDKTMSMVAANVWANILAIPVLTIYLGGYILLWGWPTGLSWVWGEFVGAVIILIVSVIIHELLHGIGYRLGGASWREIKFGVKQLTPYAHCEIPLRLAAYRVAVLLPGLILGVLPAVIGLVWGIWLLTLYGAVMSAAALGDALILWLLRDAPPAAQVLDHPSKVGCELILP